MLFFYIEVHKPINTQNIKGRIHPIIKIYYYYHSNMFIVLDNLLLVDFHSVPNTLVKACY